MNINFELQNNKNVNNYECLLKRMLYCPGNGQELLSVLGVTLVCHAPNVFLVLKVPLSIIDTFSKSSKVVATLYMYFALFENDERKSFSTFYDYQNVCSSKSADYEVHVVQEPCKC